VKNRLLLCVSLLLPFALPATETRGNFFTEGKLSLNARLRYEGVEQSGLLEASAFTLRTRLGFTTGAYAGFRAMVEGENIIVADGDRYNQSGLNPAAARRAVVADPEVSEFNQVWVSYATGKTAATLGRQRLVLENQRFIGDVGWRQNQQTFDAFVVQDKTLGQTTLTYAYLDRINRVFGGRHPQGHWDSKSHLLNASRAGLPAAGTLVAYAYWLDFANSPANSCATWGGSYTGALDLSAAAKLAFRAEFATQTDHGSSRLDYAAHYYLAEAGATGKPGSLSLGYEVLGSDHNVGFKTPLATLHAFNGWADIFLATPAAGLVNTYVKGAANFPHGFAFTTFYHWFESDAGRTKFGHEFDALVSRKFGKYVTAAAKYADFRRDGPIFPNVRKVWVQLEFVY
jgi:hypothetical protein